MGDADILFEHRGHLGLITLNRPKALNALTHDMALRLERQLDLWRDDDAVTVVAIQGAGDKAFCAGGDIRVLYDAGKVDGRNNWQFYADEYRLNTKIKRYPKPYVSIMDGIVMGGGVGVSIHGNLRIATERTVFAMPETGIGLFPDVGGTNFLPRLPGQTGMWLGLMGRRLRSREVLSTGICDEIIHACDVETLINLMSCGLIDVSGNRIPKDQLLEYFNPIAVDPPGDRQDGWETLPNRRLIDAAFGQESVDEILQWLSDSQTDWAREWRKTILSKSPTCTRIAFRQIREGANLDFEDCMRLEYRLARFCMTRPDFYEGVRAVILDKDNAPKWNPATLTEADDAHVASAFAPLGDEELAL